MPETEMEILEEHVAQEYEAGFVTDQEQLVDEVEVVESLTGSADDCLRQTSRISR
jgi:hypothetical protein